MRTSKRLMEEIRKAWKIEPFRPFQLRLVDGKTHRVLNPDQVRAWPPVWVVYVSPQGELDLYDISQILSIEPLPRRKSRKRRTG